MLADDPRLRKHAELFEAKIPTSWVAPELLELGLQIFGASRKLDRNGVNLEREKVLELVMQFTYHVFFFKVCIVNVHGRGAFGWFYSPSPKTGGPRASHG